MSLEKTKGVSKKATGFVDETAINNFLIQDCSHRTSYNYGGHKAAVEPCQSACQLFVQGASGGQMFSSNLIQSFLKRVTQSSYTYNPYYNREYCCVAKTPDIVKNALNEILTTTVPNNESLMLILGKPQLDSCFHTLVTKNKNFDKFSDAFVKMAITDRFEHSCSDADDSQLINAIFDHCDLAVNIKDLVKCRNKTLNVKIAQFLDKYDGSVTQNMLYAACQSLPYTRDVFRTLMTRGIVFNDDALDIVCEYCNIDSLKFVFDETRLTPKKRHFEKLVISKSYIDSAEYDRTNGYYGRRSATTGRYRENAYSPEKMEVLIAYGYKPDYDDVTFGTKYKAEIPNISRFDIKPDRKLLEKCWDYDFYPAYNFDCITKEMIELQKFCKTKQKSSITSLLKTMVPDRKCMENACTFKNNKPILDLLEKKGGKYTIKCIENCAKEFSSNDTLLHIIETFKKQQEADLSQFEEKIKKLEAQLVQLGGKIDGITASAPNEPVQKSQVATDAAIQQLKTELLDESDEELITVDMSAKTGKKSKEDPSEDTLGDNFEDILAADDVATETESEIKCIDFSKHTLKKPANTRTKAAIPAVYKTYFKKKDEQMSFIALKKEFTDKIIKNKWYKEDNKNYIDLPKPLRKKLKLDDKSYVSIDDIDKLVTLFYSV